ncbi:MAG: TolC family protein [Myxococcales bacterium]|nr:TolC family protein [Myxococcales bacterium]
MKRRWFTAWAVVTVLILAASAPAFALDLKECLSRGLAHSDRVLAARAEMEQRDQERYAAATRFLPQVTLQAHQTWLDVHDTMPDMSLTLPAGLPAEQAALFGSMLGQIDFNAFTAVPDHDNDLTLQAYQPLTQIPRLALYDRMASNTAEAARLGYRATRDRIALYLAMNYFQALIAEKKTATLEQALARVERLETDAQAMKTQGLITKADLLKIQMSRSEVALQLKQARSDEAYAKSYLAKLLDLPLAEIELRDPPTALADHRELAWHLEQGERDRPEIQLTRLQEKIARENRAASYLQLLPDVGAVAAANWNDDGLDTTPDRTYSAGFVLTWNFWGLGGDVLQSRATAYAAEKTMHEARGTRIDLQMSIEKAWRDANLARESVETNRQVLAQAEENFRIEQNRYRVGQTTTTDLLGAQTQLTSAQTGYDAASYLAVLADASLAAAIGEIPFQNLRQADDAPAAALPSRDRE